MCARLRPHPCTQKIIIVSLVDSPWCRPIYLNEIIWTYQVIQTIMVEPDVTAERVLNYVRDEFIFTHENADRRWFQQINAVDRDKLRIFRNDIIFDESATRSKLRQQHRAAPLDRKCMCFVIQLNERTII